MDWKLINEWKSCRNTSQKTGYLLVQLLIMIIPPIWATHTFQVNPYITNPYKEFLIYLGGITGSIIAGLPAELLESVIPKTASSVIFSILYVLLAIACYIRYYSPSNNKLIKVSLVNGYLAVWSVVFGYVFQFLAMQ